MGAPQKARGPRGHGSPIIWAEPQTSISHSPKTTIWPRNIFPWRPLWRKHNSASLGRWTRRWWWKNRRMTAKLTLKRHFRTVNSDLWGGNRKSSAVDSRKFGEAVDRRCPTVALCVWAELNEPNSVQPSIAVIAFFTFHGQRYGTTKARYRPTLATKLNSTRSTLLKVDCCRKRQQIGNNVNSSSTACRGRLCCGYGQLCCPCVPGLTSPYRHYNQFAFKH